ncbi:MAG: hypothetical protein KIT69_07925 [Propionibacteriaceae bacterium]|nr:hypothetical protein [Propionibacteriaceae bacterium]
MDDFVGINFVNNPPNNDTSSLPNHKITSKLILGIDELNSLYNTLYECAIRKEYLTLKNLLEIHKKHMHKYIYNPCKTPLILAVVNFIDIEEATISIFCTLLQDEILKSCLFINDYTHTSVIEYIFNKMTYLLCFTKNELFKLLTIIVKDDFICEKIKNGSPKLLDSYIKFLEHSMDRQFFDELLNIIFINKHLSDICNNILHMDNIIKNMDKCSNPSKVFELFVNKTTIFTNKLNLNNCQITSICFDNLMIHPYADKINHLHNILNCILNNTIILSNFESFGAFNLLNKEIKVWFMKKIYDYLINCSININNDIDINKYITYNYIHKKYNNSDTTIFPEGTNIPNTNIITFPDNIASKLYGVYTMVFTQDPITKQINGLNILLPKNLEHINDNIKIQYK